MRAWTIEDSATLYGIPNWGRDFVRINPKGHVEIAPAAHPELTLDLKELVDHLRRRQIELPLLIRFADLLQARVDHIAGTFNTAITENGYKGAYRGVYPIKVNQQRTVVEDIVRFGRPWHLGLEAGSKPELLIALALLDDPNALLICNGYKDEAYMRTAFTAQRLGRRVIIVIEKSHELTLAIRLAKQEGIRPLLGVRAKLASRGAGRWEGSSGDRAKFGLTASELIGAVKELREADMLDCLQLLHFHIGSQVSAIRSFKNALKEAGRYYVELHKLGAHMRYFDVGGGLGVDYDGSSSNFASSVNYSVEEYAADVVTTIQAACDSHDVPHPIIVTESGRALAAHHAVLVVEVLGASEHPTQPTDITPPDGAPAVLFELLEARERVTPKGYQEAWHDALGAREQVQQMFNLGLLDLEQRATAEGLFWQIAERVRSTVRDMPYVPDEFNALTRNLADTYFCNFSVFQSIPDAWAVDQLFPILPIHRHETRPTRQGILADITCDSDGKLDKFIDLQAVKDALELHAPGADPYYLGMFLVGAYQEILGDLHNLFGDTNTVVVTLLGDGRYRLDSVLEGDTVTDVLNYVQYSRTELIRRVRGATEDALKAGELDFEDAAALVRDFVRGLDDYTYLSR